MVFNILNYYTWYFSEPNILDQIGNFSTRIGKKKHIFWDWGRISAPNFGDREPCIETYTVELFCSACVVLELRTVWCRDKSKNMSAQPDQSDKGVIQRWDLCLKSHPKDRRSGVSILRSLGCLSQPDRKIRFRANRNQMTVYKSVKRYFGGMVSWEKRPFVMCVQQISESDCTAY